MKIQITQPKIQSFPDEWAPFPGFTFLFHNPGNSLQKDKQQHIKILKTDRISFYSTIWDTFSSSITEYDWDKYLAVLPYSSYHVTFIDGLNKDNLPMLPETRKKKFHRLLKSLPASFDQLFQELKPLHPFFTHPFETITFTFKEIRNWENKVLIIVLEPFSDTDQIIFRELMQIRQYIIDTYCSFFHTSFFKKWNHYTPHVSLAYFPNEEIGKKYTKNCLEFSNRIETHLKNQNISFHSFGFYGFTDMINFFTY